MNREKNRGTVGHFFTSVNEFNNLGLLENVWDTWDTRDIWDIWDTWDTWDIGDSI